MSLYESSYTLKAAESYTDKASFLNEFFSNELGLLEKDGIYYYDEQKSGVGIRASATSNSIVIDICYSNGTLYDQLRITKLTYNISQVIYYHVGAGRNVIYIWFSDETGINTCRALCAAKTESGDWGIFCNDTMYIGDKKISMTLSTAASDMAEFTMVKMPSQTSSKDFVSLFKIISAPMFSEKNTLIWDGDKIYRIVTVDSKASSGVGSLPCIAFDVEEDD